MLKLTDVSFSYEQKPVLKDLSLALSRGERLAIMGPSGCGKSTLLNLIAGLLSPTGGRIESQFQKIAYVFQEPRLLPWLNIEQNIRAVLPKAADNQQIRDVLQTVGLEESHLHYPDELSGGMKIRASLARALAYGGDLFLLDEPFAALDKELRIELLEVLCQYLKQNQAAAVLVTHQREDAEAFSDRILELPLL